jgi:hypothetical protein
MAEQILKRHPIRGLLYGIFFGLGLTFVAVGQGWAALGTAPPIILFVVGLIVGTVWGLFGPAKRPKGPEPVEVTPTTPTESSRFDEVADDGSTADDDTTIGEDAVDTGDGDGDDHVTASDTP